MRLNEVDLRKFGHTIQLAGAVYVGEGKLYLTMLPDESGEVLGGPLFESHGAGADTEVVALNMDLDEWAVFLRQSDLLETEVLAKATDGGITKAIIRKSQRQISQGVSWSVYKRDAYRCRYCAVDDVPLTVDHLVLWEEGGPSIMENLLTACRRCNKTRGNTQYADWLQHGYYRAVSKKLTPATREANAALTSTLGSIPRTVHQPSHR